MSNLKFHTLQISDLRRETSDCVSIAFEIPESLREVFSFKQGQYITFKTDLGGQDIRRSYSICSSPLDKELRVAVKKVPHGVFSTYANEQLKKGDSLEVMPPNGRFFTEMDEKNEKNYVAFASGSGITPIMSIMKTVLQSEPHSKFTLFYGNKNAASVIFREGIEGLKNKYLERLSVYYILSRERSDSEILNGRIDTKKCDEFCTHFTDVESVSDFFLCGPEEMIFAVKENLQKRGVEPKKIHFELFSSVGAQKSVTQNTNEKQSGAISEVSIKLDGKVMSFGLSSNGLNILDAALQMGADLPYACKGGVCCTCKAKIVEGEVKMDLNYGLEPDEIENKYILTCQAHPITEKVVVDFDV